MLAVDRKGCGKCLGKRTKLNEHTVLCWVKLNVGMFKVMCDAGQTQNSLDTQKVPNQEYQPNERANVFAELCPML